VAIAANGKNASQWHSAARSRASWFFAGLVFATVTFVMSQAFGQAPAFKSEKIDEALLTKPAIAAMDQARKEASTIKDLTQWPKMGAFDAYYKKYLSSKMKDEEYVSEVGTISHSMLEDLDKALNAKSPAASLIHKHIIELAKSVSSANYHPAARINATLMLALINDAPEDKGAKKPPVPAADALSPLVTLYMNPNSPDAVKAVALQGVARHVSLNAVKNPRARDIVVNLMRELVKAEPPAGRSVGAHAFMQRYAVDILSMLADPNKSPETAQTLVALSTNKDKPSLIAAYAASKCAAIKPGTQKLEKLPPVLQNWAARAADTVDGEIARINTLTAPVAVRDQPAMPVADAVATNSSRSGGYGSEMEGMGMSMGSESMGMSMSGSEMDPNYGMEMGMGMGMGMGMVPQAKPQPVEVIASRRRINHVLQQLQLGVTGQVAIGEPKNPAGLVAAADPADKVAFTTWITTIGEVVTAINVDTLDDRTKFLAELAVQSAVLRKLSGVVVDPTAKPAAANTAMVAPLDGLDPLAAPPMDAPVINAAPATAPLVGVPAAAPVPAASL